MADIAFLLLIFFLVTTTINVDTGIGMVLPPPLDEEVDPPPIRERNQMNILVNAQGLILMDEQPTAITEVREKLKSLSITLITMKLLQYHLKQRLFHSKLRKKLLTEFTLICWMR